MFKFSKAVLITFLFGAASWALAEKMPESPKQKEQRIESELNVLFKKGLDAASFKLDRERQVEPFAIIKKRRDGKFGVFSLENTPKNQKLSINQKALSIRRYLSEMAVANEITSSLLAMYAVVKAGDGQVNQGLTFEIEHVDGISMLRFLPVSEYKDAQDPSKNKLVLEVESLKDTQKPATVFTELAKALRQQN